MRKRVCVKKKCDNLKIMILKYYNVTGSLAARGNKNSSDAMVRSGTRQKMGFRIYLLQRHCAQPTTSSFVCLLLKERM